MAGVLRKILNILVFLKLYYIHPFLATAKTFLGLSQQCQAQWARLTFNYLRVKLKQLRGSKALKEGKVMVYANHRSQADFFLDNVILKFQTNFLSRMAVLIASPGFIVSYKSVWFFNRNNKTQPQKFNQWLDKKFEQSHRPGLLVYPEGHRMQGSIKVDQTKMKTGMIKYAYRRKLPSQILMTFGNQDILDQKRIHLKFDQTCFYKLSEIIDPANFQTQAAYIQKVKKRFCQFFDQTYKEYLKQKGTKTQTEQKQSAKNKNQ